VTVFNDPAVLRSCLARSIDAGIGSAPATDYIAVDNTDAVFASAGAALNHGAAQARHEYIAFVHQDVVLHRLAALEEAAGMLADDPGIGLLGAVGVTADGRFLGRVRDRILLLGEPAARPRAVDSVDELLFVVPRRALERMPLTEDPELAWHAYAVELGLRMRAAGLRVCAADIPVTHNSLTGNLDRLDVAYAAIAERHRGAMPVMTPQGRVGGPPPLRRRTSVLAGQRWRYRWLRESRAVRDARRGVPDARCVLADIRLDIDDLLAALPAGAAPLVVNLDETGSFLDAGPDPLALERAGLPLRVTSCPPARAGVLLGQTGAPVLVTNAGPTALRGLVPFAGGEIVLGYRSSIGPWMLTGAPRSALPASWDSARATPFGMSRSRG